MKSKLRRGEFSLITSHATELIISFLLVILVACMPLKAENPDDIGRQFNHIVRSSEHGLRLRISFGSLKLTPDEKFREVLLSAKKMPERDFIRLAERQILQTKNATVIICLAKILRTYPKNWRGSLRRVISAMRNDPKGHQQYGNISRAKMIDTLEEIAK